MPGNGAGLGLGGGLYLFLSRTYNETAVQINIGLRQKCLMVL